MILAAHIQPADVQDRDGALPVLKEVRRLFPFIERVFADGGYQGAATAAAVRELGVHRSCPERTANLVAPDGIIGCFWKPHCGWFGQVRRGATSPVSLAPGTRRFGGSGGGRKRTYSKASSRHCPATRISNTP
jgi:hypothetical protein